MLYGTIKISPEQKMGKWSVFSTAEDHKKIGALVIDVRRQTKPAQPPTRTLTSLLGRYCFNLSS